MQLFAIQWNYWFSFNDKAPIVCNICHISLYEKAITDVPAGKENVKPMDYWEFA